MNALDALALSYYHSRRLQAMKALDALALSYYHSRRLQAMKALDALAVAERHTLATYGRSGRGRSDD